MCNSFRSSVKNRIAAQQATTKELGNAKIVFIAQFDLEDCNNLSYAMHFTSIENRKVETNLKL